MTASDAIMVLLEDSNAQKTSKTSFRRVNQALDALGSTGEGRNRILRYLDYLDGNNRPYHELHRKSS